jgi:hypothetical protein
VNFPFLSSPLDPRFAGFAQASGQTLTIKGYRITLDTQALSHGLRQDGIEDWAFGDLSPGRHDITMVPTQIPSVGYQFASPGSPEIGVLSFNLEADEPSTAIRSRWSRGSVG